MYDVIMTELANDDLDSIVAYIAEKLMNKSAASSFMDEVEKCISGLKQNPLIYSKCRDELLEKRGYRKALIKNYVLIFSVNETEKRVCILRLFYSGQDYAKLI